MDKYGKLSYEGDATSNDEVMIQNAIDNPHIQVELKTTSINYLQVSSEKKQYMIVGGYVGR